MSTEALLVLILILSGLTIGINVGALLYGLHVRKKHMRILNIRPIGQAIFKGLLLCVAAQSIQIAYLTGFFLVRAPYTITSNSELDAPQWLGVLSTMQYFIFYGEAITSALTTIVISWGISQMPKHAGRFHWVPMDPRDLTDEQLRKAHRVVSDEKDTRDVIRDENDRRRDERDVARDERDVVRDEKDRVRDERDRIRDNE